MSDTRTTEELVAAIDAGLGHSSAHDALRTLTSRLEALEAALKKIADCDISCLDPDDYYCPCGVDDPPCTPDEVRTLCFAGMAHAALGHPIEPPDRGDDDDAPTTTQRG